MDPLERVNHWSLRIYGVSSIRHVKKIKRNESEQENIKQEGIEDKRKIQEQ